MKEIDLNLLKFSLGRKIWQNVNVDNNRIERNNARSKFSLKSKHILDLNFKISILDYFLRLRLKLLSVINS